MCPMKTGPKFGVDLCHEIQIDNQGYTKGLYYSPFRDELFNVLRAPKILVPVQPVFVDEHTGSLGNEHVLHLCVLQAPLEL